MLPDFVRVVRGAAVTSLICTLVATAGSGGEIANNTRITTHEKRKASSAAVRELGAGVARLAPCSVLALFHAHRRDTKRCRGGYPL
jgi:hypothetical protein